MSGMILHNYELSEKCYTVRLMLCLLRLDYKLVAVNAFPGLEHLSPDYLALNPMGDVPILQDGELVLTGAESCLFHLASTYDPERRYLPSSPAFLSLVMQWVMFAGSELHPNVEARNTAVLDLPGDLPALRTSARKVLRVMEDHMLRQVAHGQYWFAGSTATIADIALFSAFALSRDANIDHDEFAALRSWGRRIRALPGFISMPGIPDYH